MKNLCPFPSKHRFLLADLVSGEGRACEQWVGKCEEEDTPHENLTIRDNTTSEGKGRKKKKKERKKEKEIESACMHARMQRS
mmetsp:Transcript_20545/g.30596  ORF Transcript_20545/g.30596 Transcript_20545/m.30596 type:complete len:82 (+) Transcript_20545:815-1060(+)